MAYYGTWHIFSFWVTMASPHQKQSQFNSSHPHFLSFPLSSPFFYLAATISPNECERLNDYLGPKTPGGCFVLGHNDGDDVSVVAFVVAFIYIISMHVNKLVSHLCFINVYQSTAFHAWRREGRNSFPGQRCHPSSQLVALAQVGPSCDEEQ